MAVWQSMIATQVEARRFFIEKVLDQAEYKRVALRKTVDRLEDTAEQGMKLTTTRYPKK